MSRERSITPTTFDSGESIIMAPSIDPVRIESTLIDQKLSEIKARKEAFADKVRTSTVAMKDAARGIISEGRFAESIKALTALEQEFLPIISRWSEYKKELEQYQAFLGNYQKYPILCKEHYATKTNEVYRFGINTEQLQGVVGKALASIHVVTTTAESSQGGSRASGSKSKKDKDLPHMLHPLEIINIREAIQFLQKTQQKTVLVDIFARMEEGQIVTEKDGSPEIHTIVLCKQLDNGTQQILIIDPSNSSFSKHLKFNEDLIFAETGQIDQMEILAPSKTVKIYSPPEKLLQVQDQINLETAQMWQ
ncbi:MAG: hypothetical protein RLZZ59_870 [Pseudomonadota bacterium]